MSVLLTEIELDREACREAAGIIKTCMIWEKIPLGQPYWQRVFVHLCTYANCSQDVFAQVDVHLDFPRLEIAARAISEAFPFHKTHPGELFWDNVVHNLRSLARMKE